MLLQTCKRRQRKEIERERERLVGSGTFLVGKGFAGDTDLNSVLCLCHVENEEMKR